LEPENCFGFQVNGYRYVRCVTDIYYAIFFVYKYMIEEEKTWQSITKQGTTLNDIYTIVYSSTISNLIKIR